MIFLQSIPTFGKKKLLIKNVEFWTIHVSEILITTWKSSLVGMGMLASQHRRN